MSGANLYYPWADIASDAGLVVKVTSANQGWERRARSSGGFPAAPLGVMWHHAASSTSTSDESCVRYQVSGNPDNPVGNMTLGRDGAVWPVAGGASNCSGKGGPMTFSRGTCAQDSGNTTLVNIEVNNNGTGEPWSTQLIDAYFILSNALNAYLGNIPADITSHALGAGDGYTNRKIDPARAEAVQGPWCPRSVNSSGTWSLADMRAEATARAAYGPTPPTPEVPDMTDDQAAQLDALYQALVPTQAGFTSPDGSATPLNAPWAALWAEALVANNVLPALGDIQARLAALEARP